MSRRLAIILGVLLLQCNLANADSPSQSSGAHSSETSVSQSGEKSRSERETKNDSQETGGGKSNKRDSGSRSSTRNDISKTLERMRSTAMQRSLNVVGVFAQAAGDAGLIRMLRIGDFTYTPMGSNKSLRSNLQSLASSNDVVPENVVNVDVVKKYMSDLYQAGEWISASLAKAKLANGMGKADWEDIARLSVQNDKGGQARARTMPIPAGECTFAGQFTKIQCGPCVLDVGYAKGLPELICGGRSWFGPDSAAGEQIIVQASESASMKDAETQAKSDEVFSGITQTLDDYVKWASSHGKAVEAAAVKRHVMSSAVKHSKNTQVALQSAKNQDDPAKILGFMGFK